jgi:hypothetical protein
MKRGCHGHMVVTQGASSLSHCLETGLVVSGVESGEREVDDQLSVIFGD